MTKGPSKRDEKLLMAALHELRELNPALAKELGWAYGDASTFGISKGEFDNHLWRVRDCISKGGVIAE